MGGLKPRLDNAAMAIAIVCLAACSPSTDTPGSTSALTPSTSLALSCSGCHAASGTAIVSLEGLSADYLETRLLQYKHDTSGTSVMHRLARGYTPEQISAISDELASPLSDTVTP